MTHARRAGTLKSHQRRAAARACIVMMLDGACAAWPSPAVPPGPVLSPSAVIMPLPRRPRWPRSPPAPQLHRHWLCECWASGAHNARRSVAPGAQMLPSLRDRRCARCPVGSRGRERERGLFNEILPLAPLDSTALSAPAALAHTSTATSTLGHGSEASTRRVIVQLMPCPPVSGALAGGAKTDVLPPPCCVGGSAARGVFPAPSLPWSSDLAPSPASPSSITAGACSTVSPWSVPVTHRRSRSTTAKMACVTCWISSLAVASASTCDLPTMRKGSFADSRERTLWAPWRRTHASTRAPAARCEDSSRRISSAERRASSRARASEVFSLALKRSVALTACSRACARWLPATTVTHAANMRRRSCSAHSCPLRRTC
mmetsp:Transcript_7326/g.21531  ORF Transcript_7326/g.21531 Transcript_7326/m.21531 type:complete len:375 (-) Transcript_7326:307-1431(-)